MRYFIKYLFVFILFATTMFLNGQQLKRFNADEAQMLPGVKAMVLIENGKLVLGHLAASDQRDKEYKDVDLQSGDEVLFVNGKRVKTMDEFKKNYNEIKVGDEMKLGVKRGEQRFIVTFNKAEMKGGQQIISMGGNEKEVSGNGKVENRKIIMGGKKLDLDSLKKSGANIIIKKDKKD